MSASRAASSMCSTSTTQVALSTRRGFHEVLPVLARMTFVGDATCAVRHQASPLVLTIAIHASTQREARRSSRISLHRHL
jgi:hypothetical protein